MQQPFSSHTMEFIQGWMIWRNRDQEARSLSEALSELHLNTQPHSLGQIPR